MDESRKLNQRSFAGPMETYGAPSRAAHAGWRFIRAAIFVRSATPVIALVSAVLLMLAGAAVPALAQGSLLQGDAQKPINTVRRIVDIFVWVLIAAGIGGIGWGIVNGMRGRAWGSQIGWGGAALGFSGLVALINSLANDNPINLPGY